MASKNIRCVAWMMVLAVVLSVFTGCQEELKLSQVEKAKNKVLQIGNQFLDYEITADEAYDQLNELLLPDKDSCFSALRLAIGVQALMFDLNAIQPNYTEIEDDIKKIESIDTSDSHEVKKEDG